MHCWMRPRPDGGQPRSLPAGAPWSSTCQQSHSSGMGKPDGRLQFLGISSDAPQRLISWILIYPWTQIPNLDLLLDQMLCLFLTKSIYIRTDPPSAPSERPKLFLLGCQEKLLDLGHVLAMIYYLNIKSIFLIEYFSTLTQKPSSNPCSTLLRVLSVIHPSPPANAYLEAAYFLPEVLGMTQEALHVLICLVSAQVTLPISHGTAHRYTPTHMWPGPSKNTHLLPGRGEKCSHFHLSDAHMSQSP